jgi:hypothetical protein
MDFRVIDKYLERYAESEARALPAPPGQWRHVVCIPACAEADNLLETLGSLARARGADQAMVVTVVNGRESATAEVHASNARTLEQLERSCGVSFEPLSWGELGGMTVLVVDRARSGRWLPPRQGVGLARKIAGDIALALIRQGFVQSEWIRCTDADVAVPSDYLERLSKPIPGASAVLMPFAHQPEGDEIQQRAMQLYDAYLQSYVDGLEAAGSPYAFHTIGSLISVQAHAYAVVRGIPRREAGEDFYLLNKLAKVGDVHTLDGAPVRIRGRVSDRVPFGTGAALKKIRAALEKGEPTRSYDPRVFDGVKVWLQALKRFSDQPDLEDLEQAVRAAPPPLGESLFSTLSAMGAFAAAQQASQQVSGEQLHRRLMEWNDAFRTLKLVHGLRDAGIADRG